MTRINLVPPAELMDQHLFAEFREIKMVPKALGRSLKARGANGVLRNVPVSFRLGTGHVSFFYDKGKYLEQRYELLKEELRKRGVNFNEQSQFDPDGFYSDARFYKDYSPTEKALTLIRERINIRINEKPEFYRYYGNPIRSVLQESEGILG